MNEEEIKEYFETQSKKYQPRKIKYLLIAESPPGNIRNYFYYDGPKPKHQMFFQNIIIAIYNKHCATDPVCRDYFLNKFKEDGFLLIDAVKYPIVTYNNTERKKIILNELPNLTEKLISFNRQNLIDNKTKILMIKKLVCELLTGHIEDNKDIIFDRSHGLGEVGFPMFYKDPNFSNYFRNFFKL